MTKIAFIGLGTMGRPMAQALRDAGPDVLGMDVDEGSRSRFEGAQPVTTNGVARANVVITMLPEGHHVLDVHKSFIQPAAKAGTLLIDCSTIDVETAKTLAREAQQADLLMIDAPVSGGPTGAESGTLSFMVGGDETAFENARGLLEIMGSKITHFGPSGSGQAAKACHNMICGITAMAVMEGFALADALDLDLEKFYALCTGAAAQSWTLENRCPIPGIVPASPASNDFAPGFASALMAKDLRLAQAAAVATGQATPFGSEAARAFTRFAETHGEKDFSAYYTRLRDLTDNS